MGKTIVRIKYKKIRGEYTGYILELAIFGGGKTLAELKENLRKKARAVKDVKAEIADYGKPYTEDKLEL